MTLQEMHEAVCAKSGTPAELLFRLFKSNRENVWRAGWSGCEPASGTSAQDAIDAAFKLAMEDR